MSRPSVLMVCYSYAPAADGGAERQAQRLAETLVSRGHAVGVVTPRVPGIVSRERMGGVDVHRVWTVWRRGWVSLTFLPTLAAFLLLRGRRYDVWHVHQAYYHFFIAVCIARLLGKRCLVKAAASGPHGDVARLRGSPFGRAVLRVLPWAHAVVSLNRELSTELEHAGVAVKRSRVIRNGVDVDQFAPPTVGERANARRAFGVPLDAVVVVFVGRLSRSKGVQALLDAWRLVEQRDGDARCYLLLAGEGEEAAALRLRAASEVARVRLLGRLADVRALLHAADALVLPSQSEGLSNAVLEAMATGLPVVGTRIGGLEEQIADGVTGVLVQEGDAPSLADGLLRLIQDPELRRRMGGLGRASVEREYALSNTVDAYERLYQELVV